MRWRYLKTPVWIYAALLALVMLAAVMATRPAKCADCPGGQCNRFNSARCYPCACAIVTGEQYGWCR